MAPVLVVEATRLEDARRATLAELGSILPRLRQECNHARVAETGYVPQRYLPSLAPRRFCLDCGIEEAGWGAGFQVLAAAAEVIYEDRNNFYDAIPYPDHREEWAWCYGNKGLGHAVPKAELSHHHRCEKHA